MYGELLSLRRSILMCGRWLLMFCYKPLQVSRSGRLTLNHLNLVSLNHSGYGHLKGWGVAQCDGVFCWVVPFHNWVSVGVPASFSSGCSATIRVAFLKMKYRRSCAMPGKAQDHLGSENATKVQLVKVTCKFQLYKLSSILHVIELARHVRV